VIKRTKQTRIIERDETYPVRGEPIAIRARVRKKEPETYTTVLGDITSVIDAARRASARSVNCIMTAAYWLIGRRIVECEQGGMARAEYGETLLIRLSKDLTTRFGTGFGKSNLFLMRNFYLVFAHIFQTPSGKSNAVSNALHIFQTVSGNSRQPKAALQ